MRTTSRRRTIRVKIHDVQSVVKPGIIAAVIAIIIAIFSDALDFILIFNSNFIDVVLRVAMY